MPDFVNFGQYLNGILRAKNYQVAPLAPAGRPGKVDKSMREYRLQLIDKQRDTSADVITFLGITLKANKDFTAVTYNRVSPNSSKFPSYTLTFDKQKFDLIIAKGANKGENFETSTVADLASAFSSLKTSDLFRDLIGQLNASNKKFADAEIKSVKQRTGSTKKEGVPIELLGEIIGDIVLEDTAGTKWYISLKDVNGNTFSSYSGAASLFNSDGDLQPKSAGAEFLSAFGVDLNLVQKGFDERNKKKKPRKKIPVARADSAKIKAIFERAWGMNYFYVKRTAAGWKVFWLDRKKLNKLTDNIRVTNIKYPSPTSKQITILCENAEQKYLIELRNSKAGEYPNDTKIKVA